MKTFNELPLQKSLQRALEELQFTTPTAIQAEAIPLIFSNRDLIACAQTGTGKTAAFAIPILSLLMKEKETTALVLVPTRELATQVTDVFRNLAKFSLDMRVVSLIGGLSMQPQLRALSRGFRILVATPGRLCDHLERHPELLSKVSFLVLDEADRMLDMGFAPQLKEIFAQLPAKRQTLLFSATIPPNIIQLADGLLHKPVKIQVGKADEAAPLIEQTSKFVRGEDKCSVLLDELNARKGTVLVFARTQKRTDMVAEYLEEYGVKVTPIHGGLTQGARNRAIAGFKSGKYQVLIATDIAARGIDIDHVAHVINYDLPEQPEDYIHRIGRTARAGRSGTAHSLIASDEKHRWAAIQELMNKKTGAKTEGAWADSPNSNYKKGTRYAPKKKWGSFSAKPTSKAPASFSEKKASFRSAR